MNIIGGKIQSQYLLQIKKIVDSDKNGDKFIIERRDKNLEFIWSYGLKDDDIKDIIRGLTIQDCFAGPEQDRDKRFRGWIFKFRPIFEGTKLYIKIRFENKMKAVCISIHEYGKYDGGE